MVIKNISKTKVLSIVLVSILALIIAFSIPCQCYAESNLNTNEDALSSDSMTENNHYGLYYSLGAVETKVVENVKEYAVDHYSANPSKITIQSTTTRAGFMLSVPNHSQDDLNGEYHQTYGINCDGTCSLVAIAEVLDAVSAISDSSYNLSQPLFDRFSSLLDLGVFCSNNYNPDNGKTGTSNASIPLILTMYLMGTLPGFNVSFYQDGSYYNNGNNYYSSISQLSFDAVVPLSILSLNNYNNTKAHSVAVSGVYEYTVSYKYKKQNLGILWHTASTKFIVFVVCNGWYDVNNGHVGPASNYQYLVMDYNTSFNLVTFNWDDLVSGIDF